jgi:LmbE family N-acetylglucosaminyl deacetylase
MRPLPRPARSAIATLLALSAALALGLGPSQAGAADDTYRFVAGASEERPIELVPTEAGVRWTWAEPATRGWDTVLLGLRVSTHAPDAWLEISTASASLRHHVDPEATGLRWLTLTGLRPQLSAGGAVEIKAYGATIEPGPAALRVFANGLPLKDRILVIAPHPDDAEIAAFGLYSGREATIVTVTSGNAGDANYQDYFGDPAEQYLFKGFLRAVDSVTVPWLGGISPERCYNLGYFDARLALMHKTPDQVVPEMYGPNTDVSVYRRANVGRLVDAKPRSSTWSHLVEDLVKVLKEVKPAIVVMPYPQLDTHADHQFVAVAAVEALERWKGKPRFLLYTNHAARNLYPFGPAGSPMSLPPWAGPELPVERVYAHPLGPDLQRRKLFALESMHDLRLSPSEQSSCSDPAAPRRPDYPRVPAVDYFRRGPRSEEVFFVYGRDGVRDLIRTFLAQRAP